MKAPVVAPKLRKDYAGAGRERKTMTHVSKELIYEVLKQVQQGLDQLDHKVDELKSGMNAFRGHQVSMLQDIHNIYGTLGRFDFRLERIERRLN